MEMLLALSSLLMVIFGIDAGRLPELSPNGNSLEDSGIKQAGLTFEHNGNVIKEQITANPKDFVVQYEVHTTDGDTVVVDDFNQYLRVVLPPSADKCIVAPFTPLRTFESGNEFAEWKTNMNRTMIYERMELYVQVDAAPMKNTHFLSKEARELCDGLPSFWGQIEVDYDANTIEERRPKRSV